MRQFQAIHVYGDPYRCGTHDCERPSVALYRNVSEQGTDYLSFCPVHLAAFRAACALAEMDVSVTVRMGDEDE